MTTLRNRADGRVHFSDLSQMAKSPAHYRHRVLSGETTALTRPMTLGALVDAMVLGGRDWVEYPGKTRSGKEWESFRTLHVGRGCVIGIHSEVEEATAISRSILDDPVAAKWLNAQRQVTAQWEAYGLECAAGIPGVRGGFDLLNIPRKFICDMKITSCSEPDALCRHAYQRLWHAQVAWYLDSLEDNEGWTGALLCVEATPPYPVTVLVLPPDVLESGRKSIKRWSEMLLACERTDHWPGYVQTDVTMTLPSWVAAYEEEET